MNKLKPEQKQVHGVELNPAISQSVTGSAEGYQWHIIYNTFVNKTKLGDNMYIYKKKVTLSYSTTTLAVTEIFYTYRKLMYKQLWKVSLRNYI